MRDEETLANWIGTDAERRFLKIPKGDVPGLMEWVMYITGCTDTELIDEIENVLTGMRDNTIGHAEFRNSALYHQARTRHRTVGHEEACIADTAYSKAVKRMNDSTAPESPCECGGVPLPGDWESLRRLFVAADWAVTIKTLSDAAWMDLRREHPTQTIHMALRRPFRPLDRPGAYVYDPNRKKWLAVTEERLITLAWQPANRLLAAVAGITGSRTAPPPPYLHRLPEGRLKMPGPGTSNRVQLPPMPVKGGKAEAVPMMELPVPMAALSDPERNSVKSLSRASGEVFLDSVLTWVGKVNPDPRVFLCDDLIARTASALNFLPSYYGRLPTNRRPKPSVRRRRSSILQAIVDALGAERVPPWPQAAQPQPEPAPEPVEPVLVPVPVVEPVPEPPMRATLPDIPAGKAKKKSGMRMETCQVLAWLFPAEFAELQQEMSGKQALLKLKENHYKLFSEIRRGLMAGLSVDDTLASIPPEARAE